MIERYFCRLCLSVFNFCSFHGRFRSIKGVKGPVLQLCVIDKASEEEAIKKNW